MKGYSAATSARAASTKAAIAERGTLMSKPSTSPSWRWLSETWWRTSQRSAGLPGKMSVMPFPRVPFQERPQRRLQQLVERDPSAGSVVESSTSTVYGGRAAPKGLRSRGW